MTKNVRSDVSLFESVASNLFGGLHELRTEVTMALSGAIAAGETVARVVFSAARIAVTRIDAVGAAALADGERACLIVSGIVGRATREAQGGVADVATAIVGSQSREVIAPRPSA